MGPAGFLSASIQALHQLKDKRLVFFVSLIDLSFVVLLGIILIPLRDAIGLNLVYLSDEFVSSTSELAATLSETVFSSPYFQKILLLFFLLIFLSYLAYGLFQGIAWRLCLGTKMKTSAFLKRFFAANLLWFALLFFVIPLNFILTYIDTIGKKTDPEGIFYLGMVSNIFFLLIIYFAFFGYPFLSSHTGFASVRKGISFGIRRWNIALPAFALIILSLAIIHFILVALQSLSFYAMVIGGMLLVFPCFLWSRILIKKLVAV